MPTTNPDLLIGFYLRNNRWAKWRALAAETTFLALALLAFAVFGLWVIDPVWARILDAKASWGQTIPAMLIGASAGIALLIRAALARQSLAEQQSQDWLAAMPIAATLRRAARGRRVWVETLLAAVFVLVLLAWAASRVENPSSALLLACSIGTICGLALVSVLAERRQVQALGQTMPRTRAVAVNIAQGTQGLRLLGAALEPATARLPRSAPWVAFSFLLFPPSTPIIAVLGLVLMFTALALALDLVGHWHTRYIADQYWLAAQPLAAQQLFGAYLPYLFRRNSVFILSFGCCVYALGAPPYFAAASSVLLAVVVGDALLCGFATRRQPERFSLLLIVHLVINLAIFQVFPPALPLVWMACAISAWRKGLG